ncbi:FecR family protein [Tamlana sp. I1]|uniref:FecR family protein n=1 Tax=Tamlana sp. I1 TaxID=2762061 RepID=UPI00188EB96D|nr:FecR family protein [Tamlana sp. I1]
MHDKLSEFQIAQLIIQSITKTITAEQQVILDHWLADKEHLALYNKIIDKNNIQDKFEIYKQIETERIYKNLEEKIANNNKKLRRLKVLNSLKYAAIAIVCLGIVYVYQTGYFNSKPLLTHPVENITLQLENGAVKIIKEDGTSEVRDSKGNIIGTQNGNQIVYSNDDANETLVYNTLKVPYGKRFEVLLSDGTHVHLNAGTSLKYPVKFLAGHNRKVFLKGEAYFDVAKDTDHPFIVKSDALCVKVLGTQFNFSSYPEDTENDVVLVEGSVKLFTTTDRQNKVVLKPGFMGSLNKRATAEIYTKPVITDVYTSWIDGELVFRNITFGNILKKMERHYNITIINNNVDLTNERFNASFRDEPIEKILEYFKITYKIDYQISNNQIIIN